MAEKKKQEEETDMNEDAIRQYFKKCAGNQKMKYAARHVS